MSDYLSIHPENPQQRLIAKAAEIVRKGGVIAYPTDSVYAIGCHIGDKQAMDRIRAIRQVDKNHNFTLMCRDLSELASYARVDNSAFRSLKAHTPGPFTFILPATSEVPRRLMHPKRKTIGIRVPDNAIVQAMVTALGNPIVSTSIKDEDQVIEYTTDPELIFEKWKHLVDVVVDGGYGGNVASTVIDLTGDTPILVRQGKGSSSL